jgi:DtxR family Mn-dependent transcriptional regulator
MREKLTYVIEDYLKTIYDLTVESGRATTNQIADRMGVTPASVTNMIQKLAATNPPLLEYRKHRGVTLTPEGEKIALEIIRHHRLLEVFLHQTLGYSWDEVHEEADRLEHVISEEFESRIDESLGHPRMDPHGDPIPTRDLHLPDATMIPLSEIQPGQRATVQRVRDTNPEMLRYLSDMGLTPGIQIIALDISPFDENLRLQIEGQDQVIVFGPKITSQVFVDLSTN